MKIYLFESRRECWNWWPIKWETIGHSFSLFLSCQTALPLFFRHRSFSSAPRSLRVGSFEWVNAVEFDASSGSKWDPATRDGSRYSRNYIYSHSARWYDNNKHHWSTYTKLRLFVEIARKRKHCIDSSLEWHIVDASNILDYSMYILKGYSLKWIRFFQCFLRLLINCALRICLLVQNI